MNQITTIIPVHEFNTEIENYLTKAIESVIEQEEYINDVPLLIISPKEVEKQIKTKFGYINNKIEYITNENDTSYQNQVNIAVSHVDTEYFTVLELDDVFGKTYMKNMNNYILSYPDIDIFLSMMIEINEKNEGLKITNETVWAQQFVGENGEIGYLNLNLLKQYSDFKLSGATIKKREFLNVGGYKTKIKLTFMYEFLLRVINNGFKIYSIPKFLYKHLSTRPNSMFDIYSKTMPIEERKYWFNVALTESNFTNDRDIIKL